MKYSVDDIKKEFYESKPMNNKKNNHRVFQFGKKAIKISLATICLYYGISKAPELLSNENIYFNNNLIINDQQSEELYSLLEEKTGEDARYNDRALILTAVLNNDNLNEEEKQKVYRLLELIEDNPYINKKEAYSALKDLDIIYTSKDDNYPESVMGIYTKNDNLIKIFDQGENNEVLMHELIHCLYTNYHTSILPDYFIEGTTELLADEYFSSNPFVEDKSYTFEITMIRMLAEMTSPDSVLEAYSTGNINVIKDTLASYSSEEEATSFLDNVEEVFASFAKNGKVSKKEKEKIMNFVDKHYISKGINEEGLSYYNGLINLMDNDSPAVSYVLYVSEEGYYVKPYFSSSLKEKYDNNYVESNPEKTLKNFFM